MGTTKKRRQSPSQRQSAASNDVLSSIVLYDNILIRPVEAPQDGMVIRPQQYDDKPEWGEVIAHGEGRLLYSGDVKPSKVQVGDVVLFQKYSAQKFRYKGTDYLIIKEEDIFLVKRDK